MYLDFHGFREKPFNLTPDPRFIYLSKTHKEAFAHLLYGINNRTGFIALTGEVGSGKTTVLRALLSQLDADHHRTAFIFNPCISATELIQNINREFGLPSNTSNHSSLLESLNLFLLQQNAEGHTVVLVIDEAQNLEASVLEQIRLISNLETEREKLIQIVLSGQPEFLKILEKNEMRQLSQRITVRCHLMPMDFQDSVDYIQHRVEVAGGKGGIIFSRSALKKIYQYSRGLPRLINVACDRALLAAYAKNTNKINARIARAGINDIRRSKPSYVRIRRLILIPAMFMLALIIAGGIYFLKWDGFVQQFNASQDVETIPEDLSLVIVTELNKVSEEENVRRAFNALTSFWNVTPVLESSNLNQANGMERAASERELRLYRFSGNLGALLRLNYPAILELSVPGVPGKRFVSLVGLENEHLLIDPPIGENNILSFRDLENYWSGLGLLLWRDPLNLLKNVSSGSKAAYIKRLQGLLIEVGVYRGALTGVYDRETVSAVKEFQSSMGIEEDGIAGGQTLMVLYGSIPRFDVPRLTVRAK